MSQISETVKSVRFQVLTAASMKIRALRYLVPCSLVGVDQQLNLFHVTIPHVYNFHVTITEPSTDIEVSHVHVPLRLSD
jgi:hypothetical protein